MFLRQSIISTGVARGGTRGHGPPVDRRERGGKEKIGKRKKKRKKEREKGKRFPETNSLGKE